MKWPIRIIAATLIFAFLQSNAAAWIEVAYPDLAGVYVMPFIRDSYVWPGDPRGVNILWWIKYNSNDIQLLIVTVCLTKIAYYTSKRLFSIGLIFCVYCLLDYFMLWYDYKQTSRMYHFMTIASIITVLLLFLPEKKTGEIKSLK